MEFQILVSLFESIWLGKSVNLFESIWLGKSVLLELPNPKYLKLRNNHQHLKGLEISDNEPFYPFILY